MKLPATKVPTRQVWKGLREKAGGKEGLSKVNVGPGLDAFHAAIAKSETTGDLSHVTKAIATLKKDLTTYASDVEQKKLPKLAGVVKTDLIGPLNAFTQALEGLARSANQAITNMENRVLVVTGMVSDGANKIRAEIDGMLEELSHIHTRYTSGVPSSEAEAVTKTAKEMENRLKAFEAPLKTLLEELLGLARDLKAEQPGLVAKANPAMGGAKKAHEDAHKARLKALSYVGVVQSLKKLD